MKLCRFINLTYVYIKRGEKNARSGVDCTKCSCILVYYKLKVVQKELCPFLNQNRLELCHILRKYARNSHNSDAQYAKHGVLEEI